VNRIVPARRHGMERRVAVVFNLWGPSSSAFVWNVVIGATHWTNDAYGERKPGRAQRRKQSRRRTRVLANSGDRRRDQPAVRHGSGLQNWQDAYYSAIGEAVILDSFNRTIDRVRRVGMLYRQSGPTALAEYTGGGTSEALTIAPIRRGWTAAPPEDPKRCWYRAHRRESLLSHRRRGARARRPELAAGSATHARRRPARESDARRLLPEATGDLPRAPFGPRSTSHRYVDSFPRARQPHSGACSQSRRPGRSVRLLGGGPGPRTAPAVPRSANVLCTRCVLATTSARPTPPTASRTDRAWTRDLATMHDLEADARRTGVRAAVVDEDLTLRPDSPAWPDGDTAEHLAPATPGSPSPSRRSPTTGIPPRRLELRARRRRRARPRRPAGTGCAWSSASRARTASTSDGDARGATFPSDPGCKSGVFDDEDPACQNGLDDDGDGKVDFGRRRVAQGRRAVRGARSRVHGQGLAEDRAAELRPGRRAARRRPRCVGGCGASARAGARPRVRRRSDRHAHRERHDAELRVHAAGGRQQRGVGDVHSRAREERAVAADPRRARDPPPCAPFPSDGNAIMSKSAARTARRLERARSGAPCSTA
jgi:hypothetical protein